LRGGLFYSIYAEHVMFLCKLLSAIC
jgi:hypothetical protein